MADIERPDFRPRLQLVSEPERDKTNPVHYERLDILRGVFDENKIVGVGIVAVDEDGRPHVLSSFDPCRQGALIGAIEYLKYNICRELDDEMMPATPAPKGPNDEQPG